MGGLITLIVMLSVGAVGWNFNEITDIPKTYVTKDDMRVFVERNDKEHQCISNKLDKIIDYLIEGKD